MNAIRELRKENRLTQRQAANYLGISLRSYISYENDECKSGSLKYKYILEQLQKINPIDEEHGILNVKDITDKCSEIFSKYPVNYSYLFGSYSKDKAKETSDVDILVSSDLSGLRFYEMVEELREKLRKKVDVINVEQLKDNIRLTDEILNDGIKIYG